MLPEVGSTMVPPRWRSPSASAAPDHADADAVFDRVAGVEHLELGEQGGLQPSVEARQAHDGGVAY